MKYKYLSLICFLSLQLSSIYAQRYVAEIFDEVDITYDIEYGVNATALFFPVELELIPESLQLDLYQPSNDAQAERPLMLVFHGGSFLPRCVNGTFLEGARTDSSVVELCTQLAKRGFVAASVSYRLGWNPLANQLKERDLGFLQALYRGMQDGFTALRFFQKSYDEGNPYQIDPDRITCWGVGTGGYIPLTMVGLDNYEEILTTTSPPGKFLCDLDGDLIPEAAMVMPDYNGDIHGEQLTIVPDDAFVFPVGDTTNYPNHIGYSNDFQLAINISGAMPDISWLQDQKIPIISIQATVDLAAPYDDSPIIVNSPVPYLSPQQGLQLIGARQEASGINQPWKDLGLNDAVTKDAMLGAASANHPYYEGSYSWSRPVNSLGYPEGVVINWWNPDLPNECSNGLPLNEAEHPFYSGSTIHEILLQTNENMSPDKARQNIASIMDYVIPRA